VLSGGAVGFSLGLIGTRLVDRQLMLQNCEARLRKWGAFIQATALRAEVGINIPVDESVTS
jgi:hypothetical protein